jgi:hypothetical protein
MSDHENWLKKAEETVSESFPSLSDIDAARIVELAVSTYEREKWVVVMQRVQAIRENARIENATEYWHRGEGGTQ